jgi:hypothetical protein
MAKVRNEGIDVLLLGIVATAFHLIVIWSFGFSLLLAPADIIFAGVIALVGLIMKRDEQMIQERDVVAVKGVIVQRLAGKDPLDIVDVIDTLRPQSLLVRDPLGAIFICFFLQATAYVAVLGLLRNVDPSLQSISDVLRFCGSWGLAAIIGVAPAWYLTRRSLMRPRTM